MFYGHFFKIEKISYLNKISEITIEFTKKNMNI